MSGATFKELVNLDIANVLLLNYPPIYTIFNNIKLIIPRFCLHLPNTANRNTPIKSCCGNFSHPIYNVSKASVPSVRCWRRSSSGSGFFSVDLFFAEAITTAFHASGLNGEDKVIIVLSVDVNLQNSLIFNMRQLTMRAK